ncbi:GNAT family N-acetyltransferase [Methanomassiliicoccus luminyensis]|jgi:GNAT superfamily N-acetyltransferase|uniref:GNAT family N-acetyltransferase n=1 Tax=Methanomassiliicoccus luminyensis TaxID=1080712 RepID=UPI000368546B|nr:GNAT family N-acetyltransferase [Methanomassiliicoccus luminyensis]
MMVKKAEADHVPEIVEIWMELMDHHSNLDPFFTRRVDGHENYRRHLETLLGSDSSLIAVAIEDGHVIGYSAAEIAYYPPVLERERYGLIKEMAVRPSFRRKGVGEQMLAYLNGWFDDQGVGRIELRVVSKNVMGRSFWEKHGFREYRLMLYRDVDGGSGH